MRQVANRKVLQAERKDKIKSPQLGTA